jgi:mRNA (2'-O-methyladenosine-N6-)-methyltransferase
VRACSFPQAKNDYAQHFVDTGLRPANFIRDSDVGERFHEYPKLKELVTRKDEWIAERATPPTTKRADLRDFDLSTLGTKFDVILIDPPWDEYRRRKAAAGGLMEGARAWGIQCERGGVGLCLG